MNVVIKRRVAAHNIDALNRSVVATEDIQNGSIFTLGARNTTDAGEEVWKPTKPTAASLGVWMAYSSEIVTTNVTDGDDLSLNFRGIVEDPRMFTNVAGITFNAFKPQVGDIIEMTQGQDTSGEYLVAGTDYALTIASAAGTGFAMKKIGTGILHIGTPGLNKTPVKTYIYEVEAN